LALDLPMPRPQDFRVAVVGAGAVGLATARALGQRGFSDTVVLESLATFGQGTSSRNSCVLHAGIYYPYRSWKRELCIQGHRQVMDFCKELRVPHEVCGKLIVDDRIRIDKGADAVDPLLAIFDAGSKNGARLEIINDPLTLRCLEPNLSTHISRAIYSPLTGIVDSHQYMLALLHLAEEAGVQLCWQCSVQESQSSNTMSAQMLPHDWSTRSSERQQDAGPRIDSLQTNQGELDGLDFIINCAGLYACDVAAKMGVANVPKPKFAQGNYWKPEAMPDARRYPRTDIEQAREGCMAKATEDTASERLFNHLIYPLPEPGGLGTHLTLDLDGGCRFGPNVVWLDGELSPEQEQEWYQTPEAEQGVHDAVRRYFPGLGSLVPDYSGIRPKLEGTTDFCFMETRNTLHCLGVESPGLTASLAIGQMIAEVVSRKVS